MSFLSKYGHWALLLVTALVFAPALGGDFCWDDRALILGNAVTDDLWGNLGTFFHGRPLADPGVGRDR